MCSRLVHFDIFKDGFTNCVSIVEHIRESNRSWKRSDMQDLQVESLLVRFVRKYEGPTTERTSMLKIIRLVRRQLLLLALRCEEAASGPPFLDWTMGIVAEWLETHYYLILLVNLNMFRAGWHVVMWISISMMKTQQLIKSTFPRLSRQGWRQPLQFSIQWNRVPAKVNKKVHDNPEWFFHFHNKANLNTELQWEKWSIQSRKNHLKTEQDSHLLHFWVYNSPFGLHVNCCRNSACWKNIYHHNLKNHRAQKGRQEQPRNFTLLAIKSLSTTMGDPNPPDPKTNKTKQNRWSTARLWLNSTGAITSKPKKKKY